MCYRHHRITFLDITDQRNQAEMKVKSGKDVSGVTVGQQPICC